MRQRIDYGRGGLDVELATAIDVEVAEGPRPTPLPDPVGAVRAALAEPIDCAPLPEIARGKRDAVVVISDKTRPVPNGILLPPILETIESAGIPRERIEILVGTGLHRPNTADELAEMTSGEMAELH